MILFHFYLPYSMLRIKQIKTFFSLYTTKIFCRMFKSILTLLTLILVIFLSGCTALSPAPSSTTGSTLSWKARSAALTRIQSWDVRGAVSIQHEDKTDLASLDWHQKHNNYYQFILFGPLGFGQVEIKGEPGTVTLQQSNKPLVSAKTPELLMQNQLGWHMPVSHLYYWARGLPAPGVPAKKTFDAAQRLVKLQQQGWEIEYLAYQPVNQIDLPQKMQLSTDQLKIRLVIKQWENNS